MANNNIPEDGTPESGNSSSELTAAIEGIQFRCKTAGLLIEEAQGPESEKAFRVGMKCGRDTRWIYVPCGSRAIEFSSIPFEKWMFLSGYEAICSYENGLIE